jgi:spore cortex biosynthesis protein YabQ
MAMEVTGVDLAGQAKTFAIVLAVGSLLGLIFDTYRVLRRIHKPHGITTLIADLFYWIIATIIMGIALLYSNGGEMRLYVIIALLAGAAAYFQLLSRFAIRAMIQLAHALLAGFQWTKIALYYAIVKPLSYPVRLILWPLLLITRKMRDWCSRFGGKDEDPPA